MRSRVQRWGNSQGLRLAKHVLEDAQISVGDDVEVVVQEEQILIKKLSKPKFDLAEMVSRMPRDYQVKEESFGRPVGKEEW
ncbi:MAG: AbrB/MazE/SpoVT family DNA-binding domain-containing protein [Acidobacteriota bacterium]